MTDDMKTLKQKWTDKQLTLLHAARTFAYKFIETVPKSGDSKATRVNAFMTGYLKGVRDCGFDLFDNSTLDFEVTDGGDNDENA